MPRRAATVVREEIEQFSQHAGDWWNPHGAFKPLHRLNPVRVAYVRDQICAHFKRTAESRSSLKGLSILDVGCGGGLMAEPLARLGASVTGLDASAEAIDVARAHAKEVGVKVDYKVGAVEDMGKQRFDVITALEIAEHVADLDAFLESTAKLLKPKGLLILSTLNRTPKSFLLGIVAAEYVLGWVPRGTHQWQKFIRPSELVQKLEAVDLAVNNLTGFVFNPLRGEFVLSPNDLGVNYLVSAS